MIKKLNYLVLFLFFVITLNSCDCIETIEGIVIDENNKPIEGAQVQSIEGAFKELTDENGYFKNVRTTGFTCPGEVVIVSKEGYLSDTLEIKNRIKTLVTLEKKQ